VFFHNFFAGVLVTSIPRGFNNCDLLLKPMPKKQIWSFDYIQQLGRGMYINWPKMSFFWWTFFQNIVNIVTKYSLFTIFLCNYTKFRKNKIIWPGHYPTPKISKLYMLHEDSRTLDLIFCFWFKKVIWVGHSWKLCYFFNFLVFSILEFFFKFTLKSENLQKNSKKIVATIQIFSENQNIGTWK
jgi:hypothetical protein